MGMFKNILIPISSEFYTKEVLERSANLAEKFGSMITLIYIIEEKTLNQTDKVADGYLPHAARVETKRAIIKEQKHTADAIVFKDAKLYFSKRDIPLEEHVVRGEFSTVVKQEIGKKKYDLIVMGFEKECMLNYRLLDEVNIPIWVESDSGNNMILAVCSNLAPNMKVPEMSLHLAKLLGSQLHMLYVVDTQDSVVVDARGNRSPHKPVDELVAHGRRFASEMREKGVDVQVVTGSLERETLRAAEDVSASLVIVGREQKKHTMLGVPVKSTKRKMAEMCRYSLLFIN
jgi:nucleotide-binding universal stress UspA family protein